MGYKTPGRSMGSSGEEKGVDRVSSQELAVHQMLNERA